MIKDVKINDLVNFKELKIVQNDNYFKVSLDSILLPDFVNVNSDYKRIIDFCSGNIPVPLVLSTKTKSIIYGVELQKEIYNLAKETIAINNLENQIKLLNMNVKDLVNEFETDSFDIITCNPPYFKVNEGSNLNNDRIKTIARHEVEITLEEIIKVARKLLKNNGDFYLIHRTERLMEIFELMRNNNIEPKRVRFVYPKKNKDSNMVLIMGKKNANPGLKMHYPLIVHNDDNTYTNEIIKIFGDRNDDTEKL